jgi:selenocysteine-specific elongation factor
MPDARHYVLATAGHVDHGKSALVEALTGTHPDRLPEEKARGITIDLGFAHLELPAPSGTLLVGIVDVPGHEDFVKNMVAGVGAVDLALLVVAADDGWMPQTEEHLQILTYAGVRRAVVALTKADLTQDETGRVAEVRRRLAGSVFADAPVVPTSVPTGRGLAELKAALGGVLEAAPAPRDIGKPRLAVDRVFTLPGAGTVVTGTLAGGTLQRGQSAVVQPGGHPVRIRRIQSHGRDVDASGPGTRTALNLAEAAAGGGIRRGDVVTLPDLGGPTDRLDVMLEVSPRAARALKDGARVRVHYGSANVPAHVALGSAKEVVVGGREPAQLRLESPAFVFTGDHLSLRDWSGQHTLAGAVVLDPDAPRRAFRSAGRQAWLARVAGALDDPAELVAARVARDRAVRPSEAFVQTGFGAGEIAAAAERLVGAGTVVAAGGVLVEAGAWTSAVARVGALVDGAHRAHPGQAGLPLTDLRRALLEELPKGELFDAAIAAACGRGYARTGSILHRVTHRAQLPEPLRAAGETLRRVLADQPLDPPSRKQLAPDAASQRALRFLIETGEVVEVGGEIVLAAASVAQAADRVRAFLGEHGSATVSELRQVVGASRRIVVPLLEHFDRTVTRRQGDQRTLR